MCRPLYQYTDDIRDLMYTMHIVEGPTAFHLENITWVALNGPTNGLTIGPVHEHFSLF